MIKFIQKQRNKDGFTMVELIIVIAVMAILAAIVVPRMGGIIDSFKDKADERICANYARELQLRIELGESVEVGAVGAEVTFGEVVTLMSENDAIPSSDADAEYRYLYTGTTLTVYVDDGDVTTFAGLVSVTITNVSEIN